MKKLGIIAGGGNLPEKLIKSCEQSGIEPFIVILQGQGNPNIAHGYNHMVCRIGKSGHIIHMLKQHEIHDLVLIGSVKRPSLVDLRPDWFTAKFFARLSMRALGDSDLLSEARKELEKEGFKLHGVHEFVQDLLCPKGSIGAAEPNKKDLIDIDYGIEVSQRLGELDIGQSVVIEEGVVLGVEAAEGTNALLKRCGALKQTKKAGVLVKTCKPQQDKDLDLPTIGPETVQYALEAGLAGIAVQAGHSLLVDPGQVAKLADANGIFVVGIEVKS